MNRVSPTSSLAPDWQLLSLMTQDQRNPVKGLYLGHDFQAQLPKEDIKVRRVIRVRGIAQRLTRSARLCSFVYFGR